MSDLRQLLDLGIKYQQSGDLQQAEQAYRQVLQLDPNQIEALNLLGIIAHQVGRNDMAIEHMGHAVRLKPDSAPSHYNLGNILGAQGRLPEAVASYRQALRLKPDYAAAHNNLGNILGAQGLLAEAAASSREALRFKPDYAAAHNNLGNILEAQGRLPEAAASYREALRFKPDYAEAHTNLGNALKDQGQLEEAVASHREALRLKPDNAEGHWNFSLLQLLMGDFEQGWQEYEWRWKRKEFSMPPHAQPLWDGSYLAGRAILLHPEQGLGDTLQFIRYAALVKQRGGTVCFGCPKGLDALLARCPGIDRLVPVGSPLPPFDVHAPLLSLPRLFATSLANVPASVPYLHADEQLVDHWRQELAAYQGVRIGIAWQGNPSYRGDRDRSIPLAHFAPLAQLKGVQLFSLQKGPGTDQLQAGDFPVVDLSSKLDEASGAFMDTAAVIRNLDLVITSDTALAHLAGALGAPVWVALSFIPDWRWLLQREDSPWYPNMRLFRQTERGDWPGVFRRLVAEVKNWQRNSNRSQAITVAIAPGELIDKITILEIKSERLTDAIKLSHVRAELAALRTARDQALAVTADLQALATELRATNEVLWQVEDEIRLCEQRRDFGERFVGLARSVYRHNDRRAAVKRRINELLGSPIMEEKDYPGYEQSQHTPSVPQE